MADHIIKTKDGDLVATWQLLGETFEFDSAESLIVSSEVVTTLLKSFAGHAVTFYVHNARESFYDSFDSSSGNPFADIISSWYYEGIKNDTFKSNSLYITVTYKPYDRLERSDNKRLNLTQKK